MLRYANILDIPRLNELGTLLESNFAKVNNLEKLLQDKLSKIIVYEQDKQIVGFIMATDLTDTCDILYLIVDPNFRRKLIASNLLTYLISELDPSLELITLEVATINTAAVKLYQKFGFKVVNVRPKYYPNSDAYLMARESEK